ncbi:MAG: HAMP domain-containing histidine kinase, partial [Clostridium sp.]|nr:HAMP domain-containing histidine kinase [Clostridium sp.]
DGLVVTGYPKGSYMRYTLNFAEQDARTIFECVLLFLVGNVLVAILIYAFLCWWTVRPVRPILHGLSCLARGEPVQLAERGSLREVAAGINAASGELQRRDDALRKKDEARANWIAGISHDIRTPLSVILGYAGELQDDPALPPPEQEQAAVICRQGVRLRDLVSDLNLVSRLEYDMQPLECQWLRPAKLVRRAVTDFMNAMPENPCGIELEEVDESIRLQGDERLLLRALTNLSQNSVLHNPQGCAIRVSVRRDGADACLLSVRDDGVGADPQKLASVLNAPYAPKRAHGLGLFLVRRITETHGGQFTARTAPGEGFSGEMRLPCEPLREAAQSG